jgi:hypothetical protein
MAGAGKTKQKMTEGQMKNEKGRERNGGAS